MIIKLTSKQICLWHSKNFYVSFLVTVRQIALQFNELIVSKKWPSGLRVVIAEGLIVQTLESGT